MPRQISILSVGAGDIRLKFDKANPAESIRAARIVTDMLRRGYAILIEIPDGDSGTRMERVREFKEDTAEYIIADFDPTAAVAQASSEQQGHEKVQTEGAAAPVKTSLPALQVRKGASRRRFRSVPAHSANGIAVAPSAGG